MSEFSEFDDDQKMIGWLEEQGALVWDGVAENGEPMFKFNLDILKEVLPPLYQILMEDIDKDLMALYQEGLVELEYNENLEAMFKVTDKGQEVFKILGQEPPLPFAE
jgi:hypothetical protein